MRGPLAELLQYGDDEEVQHGRSVEQVLCSFVWSLGIQAFQAPMV